MRKSVRCLISGLFLFAVAMAHNLAQAQVPVNDNWANATVIAALPFASSVPNFDLATTEVTDLDPPCLQSNVIGQARNTLWYKYTTGGAYEYVALQIPSSGRACRRHAVDQRDGNTIQRR